MQAKEAGVRDVCWTAGSSSGRTCRVHVDLIRGEVGASNEKITHVVLDQMVLNNTVLFR